MLLAVHDARTQDGLTAVAIAALENHPKALDALLEPVPARECVPDVNLGDWVGVLAPTLTYR